MPERRYAPRRVKNALDRANGRLAEIPVDIEDHGDEFWIEADLPGYRKQDISVTVKNDVLRIEASPGEAVATPDQGIRRRVLRLPNPVVERSASAEYLDGVLKIRIDKREPDRSRSIDVE